MLIIKFSNEFRELIEKVKQDTSVPISSKYLQYLVDNTYELGTNHTKEIWEISINSKETTIQETIVLDIYKPHTTKTSNIRIGKFYNMLTYDILKLSSISSNDLNKLSSVIYAFWKTPDFKILKGKEIIESYLIKNYKYPGQKDSNGDYISDTVKGTLSKSCMRYEHCSSYFDIYIQNPDVVSVLARYDNGKIVSRTLLWNLENGMIYMDRVYYSHEWEIYLYKKYAIDNGYLLADTLNWRTDGLKMCNADKSMSLSVVLKNPPPLYYPYMDTFTYYNPETNRLTAIPYNSDILLYLRNQNGVPKLNVNINTTGYYSIETIILMVVHGFININNIRMFHFKNNEIDILVDKLLIINSEYIHIILCSPWFIDNPNWVALAEKNISLLNMNELIGKYSNKIFDSDILSLRALKKNTRTLFIRKLLDAYFKKHENNLSYDDLTHIFNIVIKEIKENYTFTNISIALHYKIIEYTFTCKDLRTLNMYLLQMTTYVVDFLEKNFNEQTSEFIKELYLDNITHISSNMKYEIRNSFEKLFPTVNLNKFQEEEPIKKWLRNADILDDHFSWSNSKKTDIIIDELEKKLNNRFYNL